MDLSFAGDGSDCVDGEAGNNIQFGGASADLLLGGWVVFGSDGDDDMESTFLGFAGDGDDHLVQSGTGHSFFVGGDGDDHLYQTPDLHIAFGLGNAGDDVITVPGAEPVGDGPTPVFVFGNKGADRIQASYGRSFAFGNGDDDVVSGDPDGTDNNDDNRDWLFGGGGTDDIYGDKTNKKDWRVGENKYRDTWPGGWGSLHAAPSLGTCDPMPATSTCDEQMEPPTDVGAKG